MEKPQDTTLIVLTKQAVPVRAASALQSAAQALGYADGCQIIELADTGDLRSYIFGRDPWSVIAIDDTSIEALRHAFELDREAFSSDNPAHRAGYTLVAVPDFIDCLDDQDAKRIAWQRMKAAMHPGNPLD